jgi:hypothetical protein
MMRFRQLLIGLALGVACDNTPDPVQPPEPPTGQLTVSLITPHSDDGALVFELRGTPVPDLVVADSAYWLYAEQVDSTTLRAVLAGDLAGALVTFEASDVNSPPSYTATVIEVADRLNRVRATVQGYALEIAP